VKGLKLTPRGELAALLAQGIGAAAVVIAGVLAWLVIVP